MPASDETQPSRPAGAAAFATLLETARAAALEGGRVIADRESDIGAVRVKGARTDMVTDTDIAAGVAICTEILARYPQARFVVEEEEVYDLAGAHRGTLFDPEVWVIDPLDGTTSFVHGFPCFSVSVALIRSGRPVVGAVYNVPARELFWATTGGGAYRDGAAISCTDTDRLDESLLITGFPYDRGKTLDRQLAVLTRFLRAPVHGIRRDGSAAIDCCHVACGRADGFWEFGLKPWDTAAGALILQEADARVTGLDGDDWSPEASGIITANPALHEAMLEIIETSDPGAA